MLSAEEIHARVHAYGRILHYLMHECSAESFANIIEFNEEKIELLREFRTTDEIHADTRIAFPSSGMV